MDNNNDKIHELVKSVYFKRNKLVPEVKNELLLEFYYGYQILIDASLSFDEGMINDAFSSIINDPNLQFTWICPKEIKFNC